MLSKYYNLDDSRERLVSRRDEWAEKVGIAYGDHVGRMPRLDIPDSKIDPDPGLDHRTPLYIALQFEKLLAVSPVLVEPWDPLPGGFMWSLSDFIPTWWPWDYFEKSLHLEDFSYRGCWVGVNIGMSGHFVQDLSIGLKLGWKGIRAKIAESQKIHSGKELEYLRALDLVVQSSREFIRRHAEKARQIGATPLADEIDAVIDEPPKTFWQAAVWLAFFMSLNRLFNMQNSLGRLDLLLGPFYEADLAAGRITEDEAIFLLQSLLVHDTHFICLGGQDASNAVTRLVLRAWREIQGPANIGLRCHSNMPDDLMDLAMETLLRTGKGVPVLVNDDGVIPGLMGQGMPLADARNYAYGGCHWWGVPGKQYGLSDGTKINLLGILLEALKGTVVSDRPGIDTLWREFQLAVTEAMKVTARFYAIQLSGPGRTSPELLNSLFCEGPVEKGRDVLDGSLPYYYFLADAMGLANVVDSFAALETVVENQKRFTLSQVLAALEDNYQHAPDLRHALLAAPKFGIDDPYIDEIAGRVRIIFLDACREANPSDGRFKIMGGFYSYISHALAKGFLATPDGRLADTPFAHGANPSPGRAKHGLTAVANAVAAVQPQTGAGAPLHLEIDPSLFKNPDGKKLFKNFVQTFFNMGGTQINVNFVARKTLEAAIQNPADHRDLVIRVTGFSAYFVNLNKDLYPEILSRYE